MIRSGDRVICAVSGGADSVVLLFAMYLLKEKLEITLEAAHFNHGLRGEESDRDERFVRQLCQRYDIPLHVAGVQVRPGKKGLEAAARDARYAFMETLDGKIATAHTADDNAETVLMHMVRGTGLKGLGAISPVRGNLIRPMLLVTREEVLGFVEEYHLQYVQDSSNDTDAFLRNRLRHHVMPLLKQENPRLSENLSAMALRLRQDEKLLSPEQTSDGELDVARTAALPPAVRSRVLSAFLKSCGIKEPNSSHIARAEALLRSDNPSAKAPFPGNITICRRYNKLVPADTSSEMKPIALANPGITELPALGLRIHCYPAERVHNTEDTFTVASGQTIVVRSRLQGDTIRLPGGTKSVKKLFIDRKIPADCRCTVPIVADENGVLGIYGIGVNRDRVPLQLPAVQIRFEYYTPNINNA
jgi:tRNA(Ile)-lysidine synthase